MLLQYLTVIFFVLESVYGIFNIFVLYKQSNHHLVEFVALIILVTGFRLCPSSDCSTDQSEDEQSSKLVTKIIWETPQDDDYSVCIIVINMVSRHTMEFKLIFLYVLMT